MGRKESNQTNKQTNTKYQESGLSGFRQEDVLIFHLENLLLASMT